MVKTTKVNEIDEQAVRELDLYWSNDSDLYKISEAWVQLYYKKMRKGIFNEELALKGIVNNFVPDIITKYNKEVTQLPRINKETKIELGKEIMISINDGLTYLKSQED